MSKTAGTDARSDRAPDDGAVLTFSDSATELVLGAFGKDVDRAGYIIDEGTEERETTLEGEPIKREELVGIEKGSMIFLEDDFNTLIDHVRRRRE